MMTSAVVHVEFMFMQKRERREIITYMDFGGWGETITDWLLGKECAREVSKIKIKSLWVISDTIWDSRILKTRTSFIEIFIAFTYDST